MKLPNWDGRMVIAGMFILGYYGLILRMTFRDVPPANVELIQDALLVLGPAIGVIIGALYRNTLADERKENSRSEDLRTAITTPGTTGNGAPQGQVHQAAETGARTGAREGVDQAIGEAIDEGALTGVGDGAMPRRAPVVDLSGE